MRAWLATVAAVALLTGACGGEDPTVTTGTSDATWAEIAATLAPGQDSSSPNVCVRGDQACLDAVVREMDDRLERVAATCEHTAAFAFMYREVTAALADSDASFFETPATLRHLDAIFAGLYFSAFDAWKAGRSDDVPEAWKIAFEAADERRVSGIGDMLLGMNAHISRDLPYALASISRAGGLADRADYDRINTLLDEVQGPMLATAARRFDPTIDDFSLPGLDVDDETVAALIAEWRREAWIDGERLAAAATDTERAAVERGIEARAALRAQLIRSLTGYVPFFSSTKARDEHCADARPK